MSSNISGIVIASLLSLSSIALAQEGPPITETGAIGDPVLQGNQTLIKAQGVGIITTFMTSGAKECDENGENCRSLFGADDNMDFGTMQANTKALTGVESFSFAGGDDSANSVSSQVGEFAMACGNPEPEIHMIAGIAVKIHSCRVNASGNATASIQVCTAPVRSNPIKNPENTVMCSDNPNDPTYMAPQGFTCWRPACDDMPEGSLDGWSSRYDLNFQANMPETASEDERSKNGMELIFYPPLSGTMPPDFKADSETMTAVKIVQSFIDPSKNTSALGIRVAYRYKSQVTKEMLSGAPGTINPNDHTSQWATIEKLQANAELPQYQQKYAAAGSECLQQISQGIASDGVVYVCDRNYTNESGIRPIEEKAQIAAEGQECASTSQCLKEVVNTNTWTEMCTADAPLSIRKCTTTQDFTMESLSYVRTRTQEICTETRHRSEYSCTTEAIPHACQREAVISSGGMDLASSTSDSSIVFVGAVDDFTNRYRIGTIGDNYWGTGYYHREFTIDIRSVSDVRTFRIYQVGFDDKIAVAMNKSWVWSDYNGGTYHEEFNRWGRWIYQCYSYDWESGGCLSGGNVFQTQWERGTNWNYGVNIDMKPYLKEGRNVLRIDTGVVGGGEGWIFLEISAWRARCDFHIINGCSGWEAAR